MISTSQQLINDAVRYWRDDWNLFIRDVLCANLDKEQKLIVSSVQHNKMTAVASGTARGKDFVSACCALCFMYLTPTFDKNGVLIGNTKIAMTAPTGRQVQNIMTPEIRRLIKMARSKFPWACTGRLVANDIRTDYEEWYLTGFKADDNATEAWSGFHAVNTMFVVTEATGVSDTIYNAIEGNLQGNSRLLLVFNPNNTSGYAARSMMSDRFHAFRLSSLNAENVVRKKNVIPGQVDYEWVQDKVKNWTAKIKASDVVKGEGDFQWEGQWYRPNDLFRVKVLGMFPRAGEGCLIPMDWVILAQDNWKTMKEDGFVPVKKCRLGVDVAGMGRDSSILVARYGNFVDSIVAHHSAGEADHMKVVGMCIPYLKKLGSKCFIDTIGEGAGCYARLEELEYDNVYSCKFSEGANDLHDITGQYTFANMRAYLFWAIRDWLDPKNGFGAALPPDEGLAQELTDVHWFFLSNGSIMIEKKEDIKARLKRSPDKMDALANTFYPHDADKGNDALILGLLK